MCYCLPVATVLTACGIETGIKVEIIGAIPCLRVATVLTACGIETSSFFLSLISKLPLSCNSAYRLRY